MSILDGFVAMSMDDSMAEYISSEKYQQQTDEIEQMSKNLLPGLSTEQKEAFTKLLDLITSCDGAFALQAYKIGVAEGIAFRDEVLKT